MLGHSSVVPLWANNGPGELFISNLDMDHNARYLLAPQWDEFKLGQQNTSENIPPNRWTLVKIHYDTSTIQGTFEAWMKPIGGEWVKVAEWIDGVTPNFTWTITAAEVGGHNMFRMPTTVNDHDSWIYLDDFAIATTEESLPKY